MSKRKQLMERIRDLPDNELLLALDQARDELFRLELGLHTNQVQDTSQVKWKRREVAQILTVMHARNLGLETQAQGSATAAEGKEA